MPNRRHPTYTIDKLVPSMHNISVQARIKKSSSPEEITTKNGKQVYRQQLILDDGTGVAYLTLWEEWAGKFRLGQEVIVSNISTRLFAGRMEIVMHKGSEIRLAKTVFEKIN